MASDGLYADFRADEKEPANAGHVSPKASLAGMFRNVLQGVDMKFPVEWRSPNGWVKSGRLSNMRINGAKLGDGTKAVREGDTLHLYIEEVELRINGTYEVWATMLQWHETGDVDITVRTHSLSVKTPMKGRGKGSCHMDQYAIEINSVKATNFIAKVAMEAAGTDAFKANMLGLREEIVSAVFKSLCEILVSDAGGAEEIEKSSGFRALVLMMSFWMIGLIVCFACAYRCGKRARLSAQSSPPDADALGAAKALGAHPAEDTAQTGIAWSPQSFCASCNQQRSSGQHDQRDGQWYCSNCWTEFLGGAGASGMSPPAPPHQPYQPAAPPAPNPAQRAQSP